MFGINDFTYGLFDVSQYSTATSYICDFGGTYRRNLYNYRFIVKGSSTSSSIFVFVYTLLYVGTHQHTFNDCL